MARNVPALLSEDWWRPQFERRLQELLRDPGFGQVVIEIANHEVTFLDVRERRKKPERIDKPA